MLQPSDFILIASIIIFCIGVVWGKRTLIDIVIKATLLLLSLYGFYLMMYMKGYVIHI